LPNSDLSYAWRLTPNPAVERDARIRAYFFHSAGAPLTLIVRPALGAMPMRTLGVICGRRARTIGIVALTVVFVASCAHQPISAAQDAPGFLSGLLHGFLICFSLIASVFTDVRIYAFPNSGGPYDLGFCLGAAAFSGGGGASAR
jgi:hypothetical protein